MWLYQLRDRAWNLLRWDIQHNAYWSSCDAQVLYAAAKKCAEGIRALGYYFTDPPPNRDTDYYKKNWMVSATNYAMDAVSRYAVLDGSLTRAIPIFEQTATIIAVCKATAMAAEIESEEPIFYPANS